MLITFTHYCPYGYTEGSFSVQLSYSTNHVTPNTILYPKVLKLIYVGKSISELKIQDVTPVF